MRMNAATVSGTRGCCRILLDNNLTTVGEEMSRLLYHTLSMQIFTTMGCALD